MLMATFACVLANIPVDKTSSSLIQSLNLPTTARVAAESYNLMDIQAERQNANETIDNKSW